jgi:hypothetical protein
MGPEGSRELLAGPVRPMDTATEEDSLMPLGTGPGGSVHEAIVRIFQDPSAVWTLDELARRFGMSIGDAIRVMSDLEAIDFVRRIGDEYVPGYGAATAS